MEPTCDKEGNWTFPPSWAPADCEAWVATCGELAHHQKAAAKAAEMGAAALATPAVALTAKRAEVDAAKRAAARAERIAKGNVAWVQARAAHGDAVVRLDGEEGDVVIMLTPDREHITRANERADEVIDAIRAAVPRDADVTKRLDADRRALREAIGVQEDELLKHTTVGGYTADEAHARLRDLMKRYAGLRPALFALRDGLIKGYRDAEGKGFAP